MKKTRVTSHLAQYLILLIILSVMALFFFLFHGHRRLQFNLVVFTSFLYVAWGVFCHFFDKTLYPKVVIEYIAIALLAVVIIGGLLI